MPEDEIQRDTYDLFYSSEEVKRILTEVEKCFHSYFSLPLEAIMELLDLEGDQLVVLLQALDQLITSRKLINNRYGFASYLKEKGNIYFLDTEIDPAASYQASLYTEYPLITEITGVGDIIDLQQLEEGRKELLKLASTLDPEVYRGLNYPTKVLILEWGAALLELQKLERRVPSDSEATLIGLLQKDINTYFHTMSDGTIFHMMEDCQYVGLGHNISCAAITVTGKKRVYDTNREKWVYVTDLDQERKYVAELEKGKEKKIQTEEELWKDNPHGFYAFIGRDGKFKIRTKVPLTRDVRKSTGRKPLQTESEEKPPGPLRRPCFQRNRKQTAERSFPPRRRAKMEPRRLFRV